MTFSHTVNITVGLGSHIVVACEDRNKEQSGVQNLSMKLQSGSLGDPEWTLQS